MNRREFIGKCSAAAAAVVSIGPLAGCARRTTAPVTSPQPPPTPTTPHLGDITPVKVGHNRWNPDGVDVDVSVAANMDPTRLVQTAIDNYGGIDAWVRAGDRVVIKPNLAWARQPAQAATTSPQILAAVISLCQDAGAAEVLVVEHSCDTAAVTFEMSGAQQVCQQAGVPLISLDNDRLYRQVPLSRGINFATDLVAKDVLDCDVYINLPIAKAHSATLLTLALKNQMGAVWDRGRYHSAGQSSAPGLNLHQNIASLGASLRPTLNIIDATRVLLSNGPKGPGLTQEMNTVIASADIVAADAYAAKLIGKQPADIPHITMAAEMGLGNADLTSLQVATT